MSSMGTKIYGDLLEWPGWFWLLHDRLFWVTWKMVLALLASKNDVMCHYQCQASKLKDGLSAWF